MHHLVRANFSRQAYKRRALSLLLVVGGFWLGLQGLTENTGWAVFLSVISKPVPVIGLAMAIVGALLTSGIKPTATATATPVPTRRAR